MSNTKSERTRNLRYKRPALVSMGYDFLRSELDDIREACCNIHWFSDDDETLLNALDGDEEQAYEFLVAFSDIEAQAEELWCILDEICFWDEDVYGRTYDDCTVALIGNRFKTMGFDSEEEDYFNLVSYEQELAQTEAGKRLMRKTKAEMLSTIGQCVGVLVSFLDLRQKYDYLKATYDILRDENTSLLQQVKDIDAAYNDADAAGWYDWDPEVKKFDRLLDVLHDRAWVE